MEERLFSDIAGVVGANASGCPTPVIVKYVRSIAIEVCDKTKFWRYVQPSIALNEGVATYDYELPDTTQVCSVVSCTMGDTELGRASIQEIRSRYSEWPEQGNLGRPRFLGELSTDTFSVAPIPDDKEYYVNMILALKPTSAAIGMDSNTFDELELAITHGVLQHLFAIPNEPWTDTEIASYHARQYTYKVAERRTKVSLGNAGNSLGIKLPRVF